MSAKENITKYLPLTESTYYIMLSLIQPLHGYAVMQQVETTSQGTVRVGPGTIYGAFSTLEQEGLIVMTSEEDRRKSYMLTNKGRKVLKEYIHRLEIMTRNGLAIADTL
jgi:DNA-binding PadR family transcriptional regulator